MLVVKKRCVNFFWWRSKQQNPWHQILPRGATCFYHRHSLFLCKKTCNGAGSVWPGLAFADPAVHLGLLVVVLIVRVVSPPGGSCYHGPGLACGVVSGVLCKTKHKTVSQCVVEERISGLYLQFRHLGDALIQSIFQYVHFQSLQRCSQPPEKKQDVCGATAK